MQAAATIRKKKLDKEFVKWFHSNYASNFEVLPDLNYVNICHGCNNKYTKKKDLTLQESLIETESEEVIDLTTDIISNVQEHKKIKPLSNKKFRICFNQFKQPRKKLD
ncbi:33228_t:CDS:2, partial [Racocetra persica]